MEDEVAAERVPSRVDEKVAALEDELLSSKANFNKERYVYIYSIIILFDTLIGSLSPLTTFLFVIIASIILMISLGKYLEFPWAVPHLERWSRLIEKKFFGSGGDDDTIEPL